MIQNVTVRVPGLIMVGVEKFVIILVATTIVFV